MRVLKKTKVSRDRDRQDPPPKKVAVVVEDANWIANLPNLPVLSIAVRLLRSELGLTQRELAQQLGRHVTTVVRYETTTPPSGAVLLALSKLAFAGASRHFERFFIAVFEMENLGLSEKEITDQLQEIHQYGLFVQDNTRAATLDRAYHQMMKRIADRFGSGYAGAFASPKAKLDHSRSADASSSSETVPAWLAPREWKYVAAVLKLLRAPHHGSSLRILEAVLEPYFAESHDNQEHMEQQQEEGKK